MARFLFVLPRFHTNALPWVRILRSDGHEVSIHVLRVGDVEDHRDDLPRVLPRSGLGKALGAVMPRKADPDYYAMPGFGDYWRALRDCAPDVVVVRGISRYAFRIVALAALLQGRRLVVYDQEDAQPKRGTTTWIRRAALAWAGIPHFTVRRYLGTPPRDRALALTIPFGAPRASSNMYREAAERIERPVDLPRILMVGKYRPRKGHAVLIEALAELAPRYRFEVSFCAEESGAADVAFRESLERQVEMNGLQDRTRFRANLAREAILDEYARHQIFVLPSLQEPAAVSPVEAVWSGCAAMTDIRSGTGSYLPPRGGCAFDARHPRALVERLEPLLAAPEALRRARHECLDHLASFASDEMILQGFAGLLPVPTEAPLDNESSP
jgi:glycosyltransferase involved in cell wall biosynthesis